jgi:predicted enzyme related to lactoylglutathione lyase/GNAT superfamily N-acetyltransferase
MSENENDRVKFQSANSVLVVRDVPASVAFYRDVLGFAVSFEYGEPVPFYAGVQRGAVKLHLHAVDHAPRQAGHGCVYVFVDEVDTYFEQVASRGAKVEGPPVNRPYGLRDFGALDLDGNRLTFASPAAYERPATAADALPSHVRIDVGVPDLATYVSLFRAVQWKPDEASMRVALANTLAGVVAIDTRDGQVVAMARATGDGRYYMLWDVIVRPSHQGQKIGTAMVTKLLDDLRSRGAPPGSFIGLFTAKPGFYGQLGFNNDFGMHRSL